MASCVITGHLVAALLRTDEFRSGDHALLMGKGEELDMRERCGGCRDRPGRGKTHRIEAGRPTAGEDLVEKGEAVGKPINRQWDGVRGTGVEGFHFNALQRQAT